MPGEGLDIQRNWDVAALHEAWPDTPDNHYLRSQLLHLPAAITGEGASGRVLEVAAAEAIHSCNLSLAGLESVVLEPSPVMLDVARERMREYGARLTFVRGIAETLPFRDASFDRVLCDSSIDHFASPDLGLREMARVCKPDGRVVIGVVNYGSASVRLSRLVYRVGRRVGWLPRDGHLFWDSPVPLEHTFECTYHELLALCGRYCDLERVVGVSMGWATPGWGTALERLPERRARTALRTLDRLARRAPQLADYLIAVFRPRPRTKWRLSAGAEHRNVEAHDPAYRRKRDDEARHWSLVRRLPPYRPAPALVRWTNARLTGDPERSWLDDLLARGPFVHAAALGCDDADHVAAWMRGCGSDRLDVYELSAGVIGAVRRGAPGGVRFLRRDLNFATLPPSRYDVVWSSGTLHHVVNLEALFDEVARALAPGALFALHDYVGETRLEYEPRRLALVNAALARVPARFRHLGMDTVRPPAAPQSPFCAVRSAQVLPAARARFDVVHEGYAGALFPLFLYVDVDALAREAPDVLERLFADEEAALRDPSIRPCQAYVVFRRR